MGRRNLSAIALGAALATISFSGVNAAVLYSTSGSTYSQNFDSLPNTPQNTSLGNSPTGWTDDNAAPGSGNFSIPGWYVWHPSPLTEGGFNGNQRIRIGAGTVNTGAMMSFGTSGSTERSLGGLASNTLGSAGTASNYIGLRLTNNTGTTLTQFTLEFDGEQWRDGGNTTPVAQSLLFDYKISAANVQDTGFTAVPALTFTSPVFTNTGSGAGVDGNVAGRVNNITTTVTGISWTPGTDLWLRWADLNDIGNDHGLGIDDVNFSSTPEPASLSLLALAGIGAMRRRRAR